MQLIVETETALDIERVNMAAVENIQNNKIDTLDIEDVNKIKCNGNKEIIEVHTTSEDEGSKQVINEMEEALTNIPMSIENNEAELSNVDLSEVISEQNSLEVKQTDESQNVSSEKEVNGFDLNEKEIISKTPYIPEEEDYLEDDIISIIEEPFHIIPDSINENEKVSSTDITVLKESLEKDKTDNVQEKNIQITNNQLLNDEEDDDVIELIEDSDDIPVQCEKTEKTQIKSEKDDDEVTIESINCTVQNKEVATLPIEKETDKIENLEVLIKSPAQCGMETESTVQEEKDDVEVIEESEDLAVQPQKEVESPVQKEKDEIEAIEAETVKSPVSCERELKPLTPIEKDKMDVEIEDESSMSENKLDVPIDESKQNNVDVILDKNDESITKEVENNTIQCENVTDINIKEGTKNNIDLSEETPEIIASCENGKSSLNDKDTIEIIDDTEVPPVQCEDKVDSSIEVSTAAMESKKEEKSKDVCTTSTEPISDTAVTEVSEKNDDSSTIVLKDDIMDVDEIEENSIKNKKDEETDGSLIELKDDMDVEELIEKTTTTEAVTEVKEASSSVKNAPIINQPVCKLSNTLDILSDDDDEAVPSKDEPPKVEPPKVNDTNDKQCIDIEDDDDIMVIVDVKNKTDRNIPGKIDKEETSIVQPELKKDVETGENTVQELSDEKTVQDETTPSLIDEIKDGNLDININEKIPEALIEKPEPPTQLVPDNFMKTAKKKLADMTRDELEEFCVLKIVESIVDRSSLGDIKSKIKFMTQGLDEYRKKVTMLTKQNRDLQVVLKSVQEEQKKATRDTPITPLKITRSVGMQVFMEKAAPKKKGQQQNMNNRAINTPQGRNMNQGPRPQKPNQNIPVPRLVPANNPALKSPSNNQNNQINANKVNPQNGMVKIPSPVVKAEKRPFNKIGSSNVTVDLTDDEPPTKLPTGSKITPAPPVRLVPPQNLMPPQRQPFGPNINSPRKVYIPISGPQNQGIRPGQTIMLKTVPNPGMRPRCPTPQMTRVEPNTVRLTRVAARHPAPLPLGMKQYQPPNWKSLPPAPDLKLSKVENGIVISWKIEGIPEDSYEEIASYQLYAYQESSSPPSTTLWKKIGDVKALPLPMACTLTQFMAGFKYYFAVRAVDIKSRIGPFSLPGSILLLSKNI